MVPEQSVASSSSLSIIRIRGRFPVKFCLSAALIVLTGDVAHVQEEALERAQRLFYNGHYEAAAAAALELCSSDPGALEACELHTSTILFQIRKAFGEPADKKKAWKLCVVCQTLMPAFLAQTTKGQAVARARLQANERDEEALFLLGKIDLNYVWLQLGTLGRKTGWHEYWEARRSLDKVLEHTPGHVRARVARAWIDYIVDTKMPRGSGWLLGGGNKKRGLLAVREAAKTKTDYFANAEAEFALWDMQVRERDFVGAIATARDLAVDFPENADLAKFIETHSRLDRRD